MAAYQGWSSWNAWNIGLWMGNDYGLYQEAVRCMEKALTRTEAKKSSTLSTPEQRRHHAATVAARWFLASTGLEGSKTPDGARWTMRSTTEAIATMVD